MPNCHRGILISVAVFAIHKIYFVSTNYSLDKSFPLQGNYGRYFMSKCHLLLPPVAWRYAYPHQYIIFALKHLALVGQYFYFLALFNAP